jgi:hypothetical protein
VAETEKSPVEVAIERIEKLARHAVDTVEELMDHAEEPGVRLQAAKVLLDRAGITPRTKLELSGEINNTHALDSELDVLMSEWINRRLPSGEEQSIGRELQLTAGRASDLGSTSTISDVDDGDDDEAETEGLPGSLPGSVPTVTECALEYPSVADSGDESTTEEQ